MTFSNACHVETGAYYRESRECFCGLLHWTPEHGWHAFLHEGFQVWEGSHCPRCRCFLFVTQGGTPMVGWPSVGLEEMPKADTAGGVVLVESAAHTISIAQAARKAR